jgi:hypothetical protein
MKRSAAIPDEVLTLRPVLSTADVSACLAISVETFRSRLRPLYAAGFPPRLPALNGWSRACVLRWIETNGETFVVEPPEPALVDAARRLEAEYAS